jgi:regulator of protease activity HflC (stomatin/prohibitin superfamily)
MKYGVFGLIGLVAIIVISTFFGSWYTVDQGERGVIKRNGAIIGLADPGLNFKLPFIDSVSSVSVQSHAQVYDKLSIYTADQQPTDMKLSVSYHVPAGQVETLSSEYGSTENLITRVMDRKVNEQAKNVFGQYTAVSAIKNRAKLNSDIETAIRTAIKAPIVIESVQIENIDFSDAYEQSIETRMLAEVEVQKLRQNAEREKVQAQITVTQANAKADSTRAEAEAQAAAIRVKGQAEADAIKAKSAALQQTPQLVQLTAVEKWDGKLPTTQIPGSALPFIGVK